MDTATLVHQYTRNLGTEEVDTSTGPTTHYLDGQALIMDNYGYWRQYFLERIEHLGWPVPIMTGRSGAFIMGLIGMGSLINLKGRSEGPMVLNPIPLLAASNRGVVLVDDVCFSHQTMEALFDWANARDYEVRGEIVALPFMQIGEKIAPRLG